MLFQIDVRGSLMAATIAVAAATLPMLASSPAHAGNEPFLGVDFGHGLGVGIGTPPSAYDRCPSYGWGVRPYYCHHYRSVHYHNHTYPHRPHHSDAAAAPGVEQRPPSTMGPSDDQ